MAATAGLVTLIAEYGPAVEPGWIRVLPNTPSFVTLNNISLSDRPYSGRALKVILFLGLTSLRLGGLASPRTMGAV